MKQKRTTVAALFGCRRRPIFPGSFPPSIFGTGELNFRVRYGNGWDLTVINTGSVPLAGDIYPALRLNIVGQDGALDACDGDVGREAWGALRLQAPAWW